MSTTHTPQSDKLLIELMHEIRHGVLHLLRTDLPNQPSAEDRSLGLQDDGGVLGTGGEGAVRSGGESHYGAG